MQQKMVSPEQLEKQARDRGYNAIEADKNHVRMAKFCQEAGYETAGLHLAKREARDSTEFFLNALDQIPSADTRMAVAFTVWGACPERSPLSNLMDARMSGIIRENRNVKVPPLYSGPGAIIPEALKEIGVGAKAANEGRLPGGGSSVSRRAAGPFKPA